MTNLRKSLYSGTKHPWCSRCWQSQDLGQESLREIYNKNLIDDEILDVLHDSIANNFSVSDKIFFLDLKLGNLCNLKCLMCGPESSSSILSEWKNNSQWFNVGSLSNKDFIWPSEIDFKEKFFQYFSSLKYVKFTGGEPFLNPYIDDILETLPDTCIVHITTNLTRLDRKKLQLLHKFKNLWLTASIDAIEDLYEIIRYPASWPDVEKNIIDNYDVNQIIISSEKITKHTDLEILHNKLEKSLKLFNIKGYINLK
jgi:MoaA/NifB/PqqE/SkfB family radical SAM enzyme